jgi:hypothetical protein
MVFLSPSREIPGQYLKLGEPGSSVSRVSGYGLDDQVIKVLSPAEVKEFFL